MGRLRALLDAYGTDDPDFNEGHYTDRCPLCELPVVDHPVRRHRFRALLAILFQL